MSDQEPRRTALETGIKTEYDYDSGLVHIVVISSAQYADVSLDVAKAQLSELLAKIGQPHPPAPRPRAPGQPQGPTLPSVSQYRAQSPAQQQSRYLGPQSPYPEEPDPFYDPYTPEPRF